MGIYYVNSSAKKIKSATSGGFPDPNLPVGQLGWGPLAALLSKKAAISQFVVKQMPIHVLIRFISL